MHKTILFFLLICFGNHVFSQEQVKRNIHIIVLSEQKNPLPGSTVYLLNKDSAIIHSGIANTSGVIELKNLSAGKYLVRVSQAGYEDGYNGIDLENNISLSTIVTLKAKSILLNDVRVVSKKPAIQFLPDKTVINPEATITNAGGTVMDILEKSPGITVSKDGSIIMKGKPSVTVLIDDKPTQLSGADLQAYLSGISASQVDVVELIENPGAKYDASGNAGIINIKTKTNRQKGFNGSMNLSIGQGFYFKTGNSINLNYRNGKVNWFLNYGFRTSYEKQNLYTLRKYFNVMREDSVLLEQPNFSKTKPTGNNLKTGFDFFISKKTTLGLVFTGGIFDRKSKSLNTIYWMDPNRHVDSSINTWGENNIQFKRGGININGRHKIDDHSELTADLDYVKFRINGGQQYQTQLVAPNSDVSATRGSTPSKLNILTMKVDYSKHFSRLLFESA